MHPFNLFSSNESKKGRGWLFLIGLFSLTQIRLGAKIGISEAACLLVAPYLTFKDFKFYKQDGVSLYFYLLFLWIAGALFSDFYNHSNFAQIMRGFTVPLLTLSTSVCVYHFLRRSPGNLKWLVFGIALSSVISIFIFQRGKAGDIAADGDMSGAVEAMVTYKLFWANTAKTWLTLPIQTMYLGLSVLYTVPAMMCVAIVTAMAGGRSAFAVSMMAMFLLLIGGKKIDTMRRVRRLIPVVVLLVACLMVGIKSAYSYAATHGYLNDTETIKYQRQTNIGTDFKSLILSGRSEFFVGLFAALDKPIVGHGSQPIDYYGYCEDFLRKYGTDAEIERIRRAKAQGFYPHILSHSHIICYWMWHGLPALLFWLYIGFLSVQTICKRIEVIPEWYGYLVIMLSSFAWDYFFSPYGVRVTECGLYCAMLVIVRIARLQKGRKIK